MRKVAPVRLRLVLSLAVFVVLGFVTFAQPAMAQTEVPKTITAPRLSVPIPGLDFRDYPAYRTGDHLTIPFLAAYISTFYRYILGVSLAAAAIMIVYGGFQYIVSSSGARIGNAKKIIADAVIGLILVLGTYTILQTINPETLDLRGLNLKYVKSEPLRVSEVYSEGVPVEEMASWQQPAMTPATPLPSEFKEGCSGGAYPLPPSLCGAREDCMARFCTQKNYTPPAGIPNLTDLVGFIDIFPPTQKEQILEKGLAFFPISELCSGTKGCRTTKLFDVRTHGPGAGTNNINRMRGTMVFRPEARDALIKAGEEAKRRGYFLIIGDGTRTMQGVSQAWCGRIATTGGTLGLATPGTSPHMLGVAVDIALYQLLDDGKYYRQLTAVGICNQVENQESIGLQYMRTLEEIMASAGFKHLASEVHHFNYLGIYDTDCTAGEWPGKYKTRQESEKGCRR